MPGVIGAKWGSLAWRNRGIMEERVTWYNLALPGVIELPCLA